MADQEDLFEHLEGASALGAPSEYSYSHSQQASGGGQNGHGYNAKSGEGAKRGAAASQALDLDLDLDLASLNKLDLEDPSLDLRNGRREAAQDLSNPYAGGILDDAYDAEAEPVEDLPAHACAYCGIHNTSCVVKCLICNKW